jgi:ATP-dependent helicase/DNAse subunit B
MAYISKINGYSLTDFHDFEECKFRFFVRHHLDRKYEIASGSEQMALGVLLDRAIKEVHRNREKGSYKASVDRLVKSVRYSVDLIKKEEKNSPKRPNFSTAVVEYFNEDVIVAAEGLFRNFCVQLDGKFKPAVMDIDFCKWFLKVNNEEYVLWGGPDTIEMGHDGIPEVIDYKSRQNISRGKDKMDMDLMPKMYILLTCKQLQKMGFKKARFRVVFWQDPKEDTFCEEFDLTNTEKLEKIFVKKIDQIVKHKEVDHCAAKYCDACNAEKREEFIEELVGKGYVAFPVIKKHGN